YVQAIGDHYQFNASYISTYNTQKGAFSDLSLYSPPFTQYDFGINQSSTPENYSLTQEFHLSLGGMVTPKLNMTLSDYWAAPQYHGLLCDYTGTDYLNQPFTKSYQNERFSFQTPRLGIVFRPTSTVAIRASAGGSFTAPPYGNFIGTVGRITPNNLYTPGAPLLCYTSNQN